MSCEFNTIKEEIENIIVIERSKFICNIKGVGSEEEAKEYIEEIRKRHSLANHNCYAYIADDKGLVQKFSDDGEPQGTAGLPMLEVLKNKKVFKVVAVVTRYFGGIKLGTGGLTRAYSGSVVECLNLAKISKMCTANLLKISVDYEGYSRLLKVVNGDNIVVIKTVFENLVNVEIAVKCEFLENFTKNLLDAFNGKIQFSQRGIDYYNFG